MRTLIFLFFLFVYHVSYCQLNTFTFNQGGAKEAHFYSKFKFENLHGFVIAKVKISEQEYRFLLDTGAPTAVSKKIQEKLGLKNIRNIQMKDGVGSEGTSDVVVLDEIAFGNVTFNNIPSIILESKHLEQCLKVDGIIGSNLLRNAVIRFSQIDSTLTLTNDIEALNLRDIVATEMELDSMQSTPFVTVQLSNETEAEEMLQFDTGCNAFYDLSNHAYSALKEYSIFQEKAQGYGRNAISVFGDGVNISTALVELPMMTINNVLFHNILTQVSNDYTSRIGNKIFDYGNVTLDYIHKKFYFEPYKNNTNLKEKMFPISLRLEGTSVYVGIIWDNELRQKVSINDQIIAVDGINCEIVEPCDVVFRNTIWQSKEKLTLTLKSKEGESKTIVMDKK
jgi:predicted aspartyl protease